MPIVAEILMCESVVRSFVMLHYLLFKNVLKGSSFTYCPENSRVLFLNMCAVEPSYIVSTGTLCAYEKDLSNV